MSKNETAGALAGQSKVEVAKAGSNLLRGTVAEVLASDQIAFEHDDIQVMKFHGIYQQDDRDLRVERRKAKQDKAYSFMIRASIPGGRLSAEQYLALDHIADVLSETRSLRFTTRQSVQYHGVLKGDLKLAIQRMNQALVTTLAACGDVARNVMATPAPLADGKHRQVQALAADLAKELAPRTGAYHQIWLDGEKVIEKKAATAPDTIASDIKEEEPLYGEQYLPRKFKVGVALAEDNSIDVYSQDVGLVAIFDGEDLVGANLLVGGGFGMTHRKADTFARVGSPLGFVSAGQAVAAVRAIAEIFRDHGNRSDRRHARLKYLVEAWGVERFRAELESRLGFSLAKSVETGTPRYRDYLGAHDQEGGKLFYGIHVASGRLLGAAKTAVRRAVEETGAGVRLTANQNLLLTDLDPAQVARVEAIFAEEGAALARDLSGARRYAMACPALPTCGLALTEAERAMPNILGLLEEELLALGLEDEPMTVRATGCPNGCARPYSADIALVGRGKEQYDLFVGGGLGGNRLADLYAERVGIDELVPVLRPLLADWQRRRLPEEAFSDFYQRHFGDGQRRTVLTGAKEPAQAGVEEKLVSLGLPVLDAGPRDQQQRLAV